MHAVHVQAPGGLEKLSIADRSSRTGPWGAREIIDC